MSIDDQSGNSIIAGLYILNRCYTVKINYWVEEKKGKEYN